MHHNDYHYLMTIPIITVVAGPSGVGKTTWVCQQIRDIASVEKVIYFSPGTGIPIDQIRIATEFPGVQVFGDGQEVEFLNQIPKATAVYMELGFYLELSAAAQILDNLTYRAIAVLPPHLKDSEYHCWANEIVRGAPTQASTAETIWRAASNGQVSPSENGSFSSSCWVRYGRTFRHDGWQSGSNTPRTRCIRIH